jgi:Flp pilus assembly protein TadG
MKAQAAPYRLERGANLVEMALVTFLLLLILAGVVDMGRVFHHYMVYTNAAREGARMASRFPHLEDKIKDAARREALDSGVELDAVDITVTGLSSPEGTPITVDIQRNVPLILVSILGIEHVTLHTNTTMVVFGLDDQ